MLRRLEIKKKKDDKDEADKIELVRSCSILAIIRDMDLCDTDELLLCLIC